MTDYLEEQKLQKSKEVVDIQIDPDFPKKMDEKRHQPAYNPDKHVIAGVCKTTKRVCKNCLAITRGQRERTCRWAFTEYSGHITNRVEEDRN